MKKITVLGCGIIGLTTAIHLERAGYTVRIITNHLPDQTTSAIAAAIWMPFRAEPAELVNQWSLETYHVFEKESLNPKTGVSMVDFQYLSQTDEIPPWESAIPAVALRKAQKEELPPSYNFGYIASVPLIETPIYLEYLLHEFKGEILLDTVQNLNDLCAADSMLINCTGLGAKELLDDPALYPVKGQLVKMQADETIPAAADDDPNHFFYTIPRKDCLVLGGTAEAHVYDLNIEKTVTERILRQSQRVLPKIKELTILKVETGLRPYRSTIRLEREAQRNIIHNYGHGGSGFTVSWACAESVKKLLK